MSTKMANSENIFPKALCELDKEALIEIIIRQGEQMNKLLEKVADLERSGKRQSAPFRIEDEKRKQSKRKAGAKKGHQGHYRQVSGPIDEKQEVGLACCPDCGGKVSDVKPVKQVIEELVIRPYRLALTTYRGKCKACGKVHSTHPMQTSHAVGSAGCHRGDGRLGKQATATALLLNYRYGMTKRKVGELFTEHLQLPLSIGGFVQMQHRATVAAWPMVLFLNIKHWGKKPVVQKYCIQMKQVGMLELLRAGCGHSLIQT